MGRGGHNRKTKQQAMMEGTYRPDRHNDPVVMVPGTVEPPKVCRGAALDVWNQYVQPRADLGWYEEADIPLLVIWCTLFVRVMAVDAATPLAGLMEIDDEYGRTVFKKHPGVSAFKELSAEFRALSSRLGMDPVSRTVMGQIEQGSQKGFGPQLPSGAPPEYGDA